MSDQLEQKNQTIEQLAHLKATKGLENLKRIEKIDFEIKRIQNSTKTTFPFFVGLHNYLRMHLSAYYNWHLMPMANLINLIILYFFVIVFGLLIYDALVF